MFLLIGKPTKKPFTPRTLEKKPRHFRVSPLPYSRADQPWHQRSHNTAINDERKTIFSSLYLRNCRVRPDIATNWAEQLWKAKTNAEICSYMLAITDQHYKFKWGKFKARSLIGSSACSLRTRLCDRRLVSWLVNSGIWQRRNSEMSWLFLQCSGSE